MSLYKHYNEGRVWHYYRVCESNFHGETTVHKVYNNIYNIILHCIMEGPGTQLSTSLYPFLPSGLKIVL